MTARDRAIDIAWKAIGKAFSKPFFEQLLQDSGEAGENGRRIVSAIERGIEDDRRAEKAAVAPS